jgi:hypothetical protein
MTAPTPRRPSTSPCSSTSAGYPLPDDAHRVVSERCERRLESLTRLLRPWLLARATDLPHPPACLRSIGDVRGEQEPPAIASRRRRVASMCGRGGWEVAFGRALSDWDALWLCAGLLGALDRGELVSGLADAVRGIAGSRSAKMRPGVRCRSLQEITERGRQGWYMG